MDLMMVTYKVKPEEAGRNEELVRRVYGELHRTRPSGLRYATFVLGDGVSFVHVASTRHESDSNPLQALIAFRDFQDGIADRCDEPPVPALLREVDSYHFWRVD